MMIKWTLESFRIQTMLDIFQIQYDARSHNLERIEKTHNMSNSSLN
jgi:hypothetical protein